MAELEIHFPDGLITYKTVTRETPFIIGSGEKCDVQIHEPGIQKRHVGIKWGKRNYHLVVSKGVRSVVHNGVNVQNVRLKGNDEFLVGEYRFVFRNQMEDSFDAPNPFIGISSEFRQATEALALDDEPESVTLLGDDDDEELRPARPRPARSSAVPPAPAAAPPPVVMPDPEPTGDLSVARIDLSTLERAETRRAAQTHAARAAASALDPYYTPMWRSKIFLGIAGGFVGLLLFGGILWIVVNRMGAEKMFDAAMKDYGGNLFNNAIRRYDDFLAAYPSSDLAEKAMVWRAIARVKLFSESSSPSWDQAHEAADQMVEEVGTKTFFADRMEDVAALLASIAKGLATTARDSANEATLELAEAARSRFEEVVPAEQRPPGEIEAIAGLIRQAEGSVKKDAIRKESIAQMTAALQASKSDEVWRQHRSLYLKYADLRSDAQAVDIKTKAVDLEAARVTYSGASPEPDAAPIEDPAIGWSAAWTQTMKADATPGRRIFVPVGDSILALDNASGRVLWRQPIGLEPPFKPQSPLGDPNRLLLFRTFDQTLALVQTDTGKDMWRVRISDRLLRWQSQPLIFQGVIYLIAEKSGDPSPGRLLLVRMSDGRRIGEYAFPQRLTSSPTVDALRRTVIVAGEAFFLYFLDLTQSKCARVLGLDHEAESIRSPLAMLDRFLLVSVEREARKTTVECFVISAADGVPIEKQKIELSGLIWQTPIARGSRVFYLSDAGQLTAIDVGADTDAKPLSVAHQSRDLASRDASRPLLATGSQNDCWIAGKELMFLRLQPEEPTPRPAWQTPLSGDLLGEPRLEGKVLSVATRFGKQGTVLVQGFDAISRQVVWRTILGSRPDSIRLDPAKPEAAAVLTDRGVFDVSTDKLENELVQVDAAPNTDLLVSQTTSSLKVLDGWRDGVVFYGQPGSQRIEYQPPTGDRRVIQLPSEITGTPAVMGNGILVPGSGGLLYWLDPRTGAELCEPFLGGFNQGAPIVLGPIAVLGPEAAAIGAGKNVVRIALDKNPFPHFKETARQELRASSVNYLLKSRDRVLLVDGDRLLALNILDLSPLNPWPLGATVSTPPIPIGDMVVFLTDKHELACVGGAAAEIEMLWKIKLPSAPVTKRPVVVSDTLWLAFSGGAVRGVDIKTGNAVSTIDVHRALVDGPWLTGGRALLVAADGSVIAAPLPAPGAGGMP